jgi:hypothetical protein
MILDLRSFNDATNIRSESFIKSYPRLDFMDRKLSCTSFSIGLTLSLALPGSYDEPSRSMSLSQASILIGYPTIFVWTITIHTCHRRYTAISYTQALPRVIISMIRLRFSNVNRRLNTSFLTRYNLQIKEIRILVDCNQFITHCVCFQRLVSTTRAWTRCEHAYPNERWHCFAGLIH